jgi:hypothetical protein
MFLFSYSHAPKWNTATPEYPISKHPGFSSNWSICDAPMSTHYTVVLPASTSSATHSPSSCRLHCRHYICDCVSRIFQVSRHYIWEVSRQELKWKHVVLTLYQTSVRVFLMQLFQPISHTCRITRSLVH